MEKVLNMTLQELIDSGAMLDVWFHDLKSKEAAMHKISAFESLGEVFERSDRNSLGIDDALGIHVTAFYEADETEEARANLTEYERGMKNSGHTEDDFA